MTPGIVELSTLLREHEPDLAALLVQLVEEHGLPLEVGDWLIRRRGRYLDAIHNRTVVVSTVPPKTLKSTVRKPAGTGTRQHQEHVVRSVSVDEPTWSALGRMADRAGVNRSEMIRRLIRASAGGTS